MAITGASTSNSPIHQYYGWAWHNRDQLMPSRAQVERAEAATKPLRERIRPPMQIYFVVARLLRAPAQALHEWGWFHLSHGDAGWYGAALPCGAHATRLEFPNVRDTSVKHAWFDSSGFNHFRVMTG